MSNLRNKVISGLIWKFAERAGAELVAFVVSIVLARIMLPEDFGVIALVTVFINIANVFVTAGFGNSLIQKKDITNDDFSTIFFFNIGFSICFYFILYISAPFIASFYETPILTPVLRVLGLRIIVASINNIQQSYVSLHMEFKKIIFSTLIGTVISAVVGIVMALCDMGVWALVAQNLSNACINTLILWFTVEWRPTLTFQFKRLKALFSYGWNLLISALLDTGYNELRSMLIGKMYSSSALAYYNKGNSFPNLIIANINSSISGVLFPAISQEQDNITKVKNMTRRSITTSSYILIPAMVGLAAIAEPLIELMLTEKWLPCVIFLQLGCITYAFRPMSTANLEAIKALGRSDIFLKLEIVKKAIGIILLIMSIPYGVTAIAVSAVITTLISTLINTIPNQKILHYGYLQQLWDITPTIVVSLIMGVTIRLFRLCITAPLPLLIVQVLCGCMVYIGLSYIFKIETFQYIINLLKDRIIKRKK